MRIIKKEKRLCTCCMEEHYVKTVIVREKATFKNVELEYEASYMYCDLAEEFYADEEQLRANDIRLKDAYRKMQGLMTSQDIYNLRTKYGISQKDLCILLGWGEKTITRYEGHQVQDRAHDSILKKIDSDSEWYLALLKDSSHILPEESYKKYFEIATDCYEKNQDLYLRKSIEAEYSNFHSSPSIQGNTKLSLNKVVDVIRYFASSKKVTNLYKVKLMKLLWYADAYSYKKRGVAITGLAYCSFPMGAVPVGHNSIIDLKDVPCEEVDFGETIAYYFSLRDAKTFENLSEEEVEILDYVIEKLGKKTKEELVSFMHKEQAYIKTRPREVILFDYAKRLQI